jgi:hypothetical protein
VLPEPDRPVGAFRPKVSTGGYGHVLGGVGLGRGVRFNNPYRLRTQLGDTAESLSLTATYFDVWAGMVWGDPDGFQHGAALHGAIALDGVPQEVVTPGYLVLVPLHARWLAFGRAGLPSVVEPDGNVGFELGLGGILRITAALGLSAELVGSLFYGAATLESARSPIPVLSMQLGSVFEYEVLP